MYDVLLDCIGTIPSTMGNLTNLLYLNLHTNSLNGIVFKHIAIFCWLLNFISLLGTIPTNIGAANKVSYISISGNNLNGN